MWFQIAIKRNETRWLVMKADDLAHAQLIAEDHLRDWTEGWSIASIQPTKMPIENGDGIIRLDGGERRNDPKHQTAG